MMALAMLRAISLLGMGGLFFMISPKLRGSINGALESAAQQMEFYAPYSYILGAVLLIAILMFSMYRGAQPQ
jgi:hypothetical protein